MSVAEVLELGLNNVESSPKSSKYCSWILSPTAECKNYSVANSSRLIADNDGSVLENIIRTSVSSDYDLLTNNDWFSEWVRIVKVEQKRIKTENQR